MKKLKGDFAMVENEYDDFLRKYGLVINNLSKRMGTKVSKAKLANALYQDSKLGKINMNDMNVMVCEFFRGNMAAQIKLDSYARLYRNQLYF